MSIATQKVIGARIAEARQRAGLTQKELAEAIRVSIRHLQEIEAGRTDLKLSVLTAVAQKVGVEIFQLLVPCSARAYAIKNSSIAFETSPEIFGPVDNIKSAIKIIDHKGTVWFVSSSFEQQLGYARAEICGRMKVWEFIDDDEEKKTMQTYIRCMLAHKPKPTPFVTTYRRKDGKTLPTMIDWCYLRDNRHEIAGFVLTLSER